MADACSMVQPVILCGGSGTRLWPLSRSAFPKQFICFRGNKTLFQQTAQRSGTLEGITALRTPLIISNEEHRFIILEQLREIGIEPNAVVLEPVARNTAPALTLAALAARESGSDPILVVTPSDHLIADEAQFAAAVRRAVGVAAAGSIVILGIHPDRPETGYGYIKAAASPRDASVLNVERFVEKPTAQTAAGYIAEGGCYWNAGMFVLKASVWLNALQHFRPDIAEATLAAWRERHSDGKFVRPGKEPFSAVPSESVDYAVMEHCPGSQFSTRMVALEAGWSDLGAWDAVWQALGKNESGNAHFGDAHISQSVNTLVHATSRLVSVLGVEDLIVVETPDAVLVANRAFTQDVSKFVVELQTGNREETINHRKVHRPWGWYDTIDEGPRFKVKRIQVNPNASLSLQKHQHRAEHWTVVRGTAEVTNGTKVVVLTEDQSTYIPAGEVHRLANRGTDPLEIIEVQSGNYLGEDDIVRLEDGYGGAN